MVEFDVITRELPELVRQGVRSFKVFLTYDPLHFNDAGYLRVLAAARRVGALVSVHCENYDAIGWRSAALLQAGLTSPKYHAWSRPEVVEREATYRAIALAELVDQPIQIFHVSCDELAEEIARAKARGLRVWAETCPHYLTLTIADIDRPGFEGAKTMFSPAARADGAAEGPGATSNAARWTSSPPTIAAFVTTVIAVNACTGTMYRSPKSLTASPALAPGCPCCSAKVSPPAVLPPASSQASPPSTPLAYMACTARAESRRARMPIWFYGTLNAA